MPSILFLPAPGSPYSTAYSVTRLLLHLVSLCAAFTPLLPANSIRKRSATSVYQHQKRDFSLLLACPVCVLLQLPSANYPAKSGTLSGIPLRRHEKPQRFPRLYSVQQPKHDNLPESSIDHSAGSLQADVALDDEASLWDVVEDSDENPEADPEEGFEKNTEDDLEEEDPLNIARLSRGVRKALRPSRPAMVLASINGPAKNLYFITPANKIDLSYNSVQRSANRGTCKAASPLSIALQALEPHSLYSILARYLQHYTMTPLPEQDFEYTHQELNFLRSQGYTTESIERWALFLTEPQSNIAAKIFEPGAEKPPLFLFLLFLRRKHIRVFALRIVMGHLDRIVQSGSLSWSALKIIAVRLVRHAVSYTHL